VQELVATSSSSAKGQPHSSARRVMARTSGASESPLWLLLANSCGWRRAMLA
jgi:hypothetical protein